MNGRKVAEVKDAGEKDSFGRDFALLEMRIECFHALGVQTSGLQARLTEAKAAFKAKNFPRAKTRIEEMLVLFSLASRELDAMVARFLGKADPPAQKKGTARADKLPTLDEVEETVEEAFRKALHSSNLRRMVEVIALEKVHALLSEEGLPLHWVRNAVEKVLSEKGSSKGRKPR